METNNPHIRVGGQQITVAAACKLTNAIKSACLDVYGTGSPRALQYGYLLSEGGKELELTLCGRSKGISDKEKNIVNSCVTGWSFGLDCGVPYIVWGNKK